MRERERESKTERESERVSKSNEAGTGRGVECYRSQISCLSTYLKNHIVYVSSFILALSYTLQLNHTFLFFADDYIRLVLVAPGVLLPIKSRRPVTM